MKSVKEICYNRIRYHLEDNEYILHREDGPALEYNDGIKVWFLNGKLIHVLSQEEFERYMRLLAFQ